MAHSHNPPPSTTQKEKKNIYNNADLINVISKISNKMYKRLEKKAM